MRIRHATEARQLRRLRNVGVELCVASINTPIIRLRKSKSCLVFLWLSVLTTLRIRTEKVSRSHLDNRFPVSCCLFRLFSQLLMFLDEGNIETRIFGKRSLFALSR